MSPTRKQRLSAVTPTGDVMTLLEVAEYLHIHETTVRRLLKAKQLPGFRLGGNWRLRRDDIDRWRFHAETANKKQ